MSNLPLEGDALTDYATAVATPQLTAVVVVVVAVNVLVVSDIFAAHRLRC